MRTQALESEVSFACSIWRSGLMRPTCFMRFAKRAGRPDLPAWARERGGLDRLALEI
jgi:hypothetical protein